MGSKNKLKRERIRFKKKCFRKKEEGKPWINEYQIPVRRPLAGDPAGPSASSMRLPTERRCRRLHSPPPRRGLVAARLPQASALLSATSGLQRRHGPAPTRPGGGARPSLSSWVRPLCASGHCLPLGTPTEARAPTHPSEGSARSPPRRTA